MPAARRRRALVTGVAGQDGSYLAEFLLERGYEVHGLVRGTGSRVDHLRDREAFHPHTGDIAAPAAITDLVRAIAPDETYHLAAQSNVGVSFEQPDLTMAINSTGTEHLLRAVRANRPGSRFFLASTAAIFGSSSDPLDEQSARRPRSPYGESKVRAHEATVASRDEHGLFAVCGILFNHESPRRDPGVVTRKIARAVAAIRAGTTDHVRLGGLDSVRDWGYAPEYVEGMWRMLQTDDPADYVLATGVGHSVREFCAEAFDHAGLDWTEHVLYDGDLDRPTPADALIGDPSLARTELGWVAETHGLAVARLLVDAEIRASGG